MRSLVTDGRLATVHDLAGGFGPALGEMVARSRVGATVDLPAPGGHVALFSETPSAVLASVDPAEVDALLADAATAGVPALVVGTAGGGRLRIGDLVDVDVDVVHRRWRDALPNALSGGTVQA